MKDQSLTFKDIPIHYNFIKDHRVYKKVFENEAIKVNDSHQVKINFKEDDEVGNSIP